MADDVRLQFLTQGYAVLQPSVEPELHDSLWTSADELYRKTRLLESPTAHLDILGDNVRAAVPRIDEVLNDAVVAEAVQAVLGEGAFLHPHSFVHQSGPQDQPFHQDGNLPWNERGHYRSHRPDWLILFYYPQQVTLDNGPTEIVPGSQYWTVNIENEDGSWRSADFIDPDMDRKLLSGPDLEARDAALASSVDKLGVPGLERRFLEVPRGSVVIGNYDLIHRGTRSQPDQPPRYMYKFYFARTQEPESRSLAAAVPDPDHVRKELRPLLATHWAWTNGVRHHSKLNADELNNAEAELASDTEHLSIAAAYTLGADTGQKSLDVLLERLNDGQERTRRAAAYGLRQRCDEAAVQLEAALCDQSASVRRLATFALGAAWSTAFDALMRRLVEDPDDLVRSNAAYSLGQMVRNPAAPAARVLDTLLGRLEEGCEPPNTSVAGLARSTVRQSVAYAVLQLCANHTLLDPQRASLTRLACQETDRYVLGMLCESLARHSDDGALIRELSARRWHAV